MIFDTHTHSKYSADSSAEPQEMLQAALRSGLAGLCVTDHFDCDRIPGFCTLENLRAAKRTFDPLQQQYAGRLTVLRGVELAQGVLCPNEAGVALALTDYDYVLGSLHAARWRQDYYFMDYRQPPQPLPQLVREYFEACLQLARWDRVDAIAHLGYLRRYAARDGVSLDYTPCRELIDQILRTLIETGKALELNTSGFRYGLPEWIPDIGVWRRYRALGGELVTIGSDAHRPRDIGAGHREAQAMLRELGFRWFCYYRRWSDPLPGTAPTRGKTRRTKEKGLTLGLHLCYDVITSRRRAFFSCVFLAVWPLLFPHGKTAVPSRHKEGGKRNPKSNRRCRLNESQDHSGLYRMQAAQLQHHEKQKERSRQTGNEQVLPLLPQAHRS